MDRDSLFADNLPWAVGIARKIHRSVPPSFALDDLVQEARIELWKQAERFDLGRGVPFQGFAYLPVRGAVLMFLRRRNWTEAVMEEVDVSHVDTAPLPDAQMIAAEEPEEERDIDKLRAAIRFLPDMEAFLVRRVYFDGIDREDLETIGGLTREGMSRRLRSAIRQLKKNMSKVRVVDE